MSVPGVALLQHPRAAGSPDSGRSDSSVALLTIVSVRQELSYWSLGQFAASVAAYMYPRSGRHTWQPPVIAAGPGHLNDPADPYCDSHS